MDEGLKNRIILVLGVLAIVFFITSINSCQDAAKQKKIVNQEKLGRMELEEKTLNLSNRNSELEQKIAQLQETLNQQNATHQATQQTLTQEITRLKEELEKVTKLKDKLEEDLKEALVSQSKEVK